MKIPIKVYMQVGVGFFFSLLILWYFFSRLLFPLLHPIFSFEASVYITFILSFGLCLLMVKPTINKEMKKIDEPFSLVARNPDIDIAKEKFTIKTLILRSAFSLGLAWLLSLPFIIITILSFIGESEQNVRVFLSLASKYYWLYFVFTGAAFFIFFVFVPSIKRWHWTKHQFG
jgi:hypothetical protein